MSVVRIDLPDPKSIEEEERRAHFRECYTRMLSITDYLSDEDKLFVQKYADQ